MVANLLFRPTKSKPFPLMDGRIAEPRYPQIKKCMKHLNLYLDKYSGRHRKWKKTVQKVS